MTHQTQTPITAQAQDGYMINDKGYLVPINKIKEIDKVRDEFVKTITAKAQELSSLMASAKDTIFEEYNDFVELSAREYGVKIGGTKGNTTLMSFDGTKKVQFAVQDNIIFDERLQIAKSLIDECLSEWTIGANDNIKAIINNAFDVDKEGNINKGRVLSLRRLDIKDDKWQKAMTAISDALTVVSSKEYIRFYERDDDGKYSQISLDFSNV